MNIINLLNVDCFKIGSKAKNKKEILYDIAKLAKQNPILNKVDENYLFKTLLEREELFSTGFEKGIAIPHCRLKSVDDFVVGAMLLPEGIEFNSIDRSRTHILFFIIAPESKQDIHIKLLSTISRTLFQDKVKKQLLKSKSPIEFYKTLCTYVPTGELFIKVINKKCAFNIIIQDENIFNKILNIVISITTSISIIEGNNINNYLNKLPLFSSFWNNEAKCFHKLITGILDEKLLNELLRSIESSVGSLENNSGIMITAYDLLLSAGNLNS